MEEVDCCVYEIKILISDMMATLYAKKAKLAKRLSLPCACATEVNSSTLYHYISLSRNIYHLEVIYYFSFAVDYYCVAVGSSTILLMIQ
jgi:hypothetical protein